MELAAVQILVAGIMGLFPRIRPGIRSFIESLTAQLPDLAAAGTDIQHFVNNEMDRVRNMIAENRDPTHEEWDALNSVVDDELARLNAQAGWQAPLPGPSNLPPALPPEPTDDPFQSLPGDEPQQSPREPDRDQQTSPPPVPNPINPQPGSPNPPVPPEQAPKETRPDEGEPQSQNPLQPHREV